MIFYFSGTGNSHQVASMLGKELKEKIVNILDVNFSESRREESVNLTQIGLVTPVYSWGVPIILLDFIKKWEREFVNYLTTEKIPIWLILVCGDDTGMAPEIVDKHLHKKGLSLSAAWSVQMPNNYVLLPGFNVDSDKVRDKKLENCKSRIHYIASKINYNEWSIDVERGKFPKLKTRVIYPLFKRWGIIDKKWHWTNECIRCGKCASVCRIKNIKMVGGHPKWGKKCVSCLSCYHICPVHAVAYGKMTEGKGQYLNPDFGPQIKNL